MLKSITTVITSVESIVISWQSLFVATSAAVAAEASNCAYSRAYQLRYAYNLRTHAQTYGICKNRQICYNSHSKYVYALCTKEKRANEQINAPNLL